MKAAVLTPELLHRMDAFATSRACIRSRASCLDRSQPNPSPCAMTDSEVCSTAHLGLVRASSKSNAIIHSAQPRHAA